MGYHVIIDPACSPMKSVYVRHYQDLVKVEGLTEKSVIYEGDIGAKPEKVGTSVRFRNLGQSWYRAGLRAQVMFGRLARRRGWMLEELHQDAASFQAYAQASDLPVKRGDFLIRNLHNLEVEVKCRTFHGSGSQRYFYFSAEDVRKHLNMQSFTRTPVVVAIFRRKDDMPVRESLCMIRVDRIGQLTDLLEQGDYGAVYRVPLQETFPGFELLQEYKTEEAEEKPTGWDPDAKENAYVWIAYYKNKAHLRWIVSSGWYNMRLGKVRGALLPEEGRGARYILLHGPGERVTGKLLKVVEEEPRIFSREALIQSGYPERPAHDSYLMYRVVPVYEKELREREWDISAFKGFRPGWGTVLPFSVGLQELLMK